MKDGLWRWRETIIGFAMSMLGISWALNGLGFVAIVGTSIAVAGALLTFAGIQRARFRVGKDGAGIVQVDEGQVTYFGPIEGGSVVISELTRVELDPANAPSSEWVLHEPNAAPLRIPTDAKNAEALFDVLAGLDGLETEKMLHELTAAPKQQVVIWEASAPALH